MRARHRGAHLKGPRRAKPRGRPQVPDACASLRQSPAPPRAFSQRAPACTRARARRDRASHRRLSCHPGAVGCRPAQPCGLLAHCSLPLAGSRGRRTTPGPDTTTAWTARGLAPAPRPPPPGRLHRPRRRTPQRPAGRSPAAGYARSRRGSPLRGGHHGPSAYAPEPPACLTAAPAARAPGAQHQSPNRLDAHASGRCASAVQIRWPVSGGRGL